METEVAWAVGEDTGSEVGAMVWTSTEAKTSVGLVQTSGSAAMKTGRRASPISGTISPVALLPQVFP